MVLRCVILLIRLDASLGPGDCVVVVALGIALFFVLRVILSVGVAKIFSLNIQKWVVARTVEQTYHNTSLGKAFWIYRILLHLLHGHLEKKTLSSLSFCLANTCCFILLGCTFICAVVSTSIYSRNLSIKIISICRSAIVFAVSSDKTIFFYRDVGIIRGLSVNTTVKLCASLSCSTYWWKLSTFVRDDSFTRVHRINYHPCWMCRRRDRIHPLLRRNVVRRRPSSRLCFVIQILETYKVSVWKNDE